MSSLAWIRTCDKKPLRQLGRRFELQRRDNGLYLRIQRGTGARVYRNESDQRKTQNLPESRDHDAKNEHYPCHPKCAKRPQNPATRPSSRTCFSHDSIRSFLHFCAHPGSWMMHSRRRRPGRSWKAFGIRCPAERRAPAIRWFVLFDRGLSSDPV